MKRYFIGTALYVGMLFSCATTMAYVTKEFYKKTLEAFNKAISQDSSKRAAVNYLLLQGAYYYDSATLESFVLYQHLRNITRYLRLQDIIDKSFFDDLAEVEKTLRQASKDVIPTLKKIEASLNAIAKLKTRKGSGLLQSMQRDSLQYPTIIQYSKIILNEIPRVRTFYVKHSDDKKGVELMRKIGEKFKTPGFNLAAGNWIKTLDALEQQEEERATINVKKALQTIDSNLKEIKKNVANFLNAEERNAKYVKGILDALPTVRTFYTTFKDTAIGKELLRKVGIKYPDVQVTYKQRVMKKKIDTDWPEEPIIQSLGNVNYEEVLVIKNLANDDWQEVLDLLEKEMKTKATPKE